MRKTCVIVIDEEAIFKEIQERKPASIAINGPDGMLPAVQTTASNITKKFGIPTYVLADTTWGSCDLNSNGAKVLGADVLFNVGHTIGVPMWDKQVVMVDAFDDVSFEKVAEKAAKVFYEKTVSLVTDSQHLHRIDQVRGILEKGGAHVKIGKGKGQLSDGQVFGCEFYPAKEAAQVADVNVFLGQSCTYALMDETSAIAKSGRTATRMNLDMCGRKYLNFCACIHLEKALYPMMMEIIPITKTANATCNSVEVASILPTV